MTRQALLMLGYLLASVAHGDGVKLFPDAAFEHGWYPDPGAIWFGFSDSPQSQSPAYKEQAADRYNFTRLMVRRCAPTLLSDSQFEFALQQFTPALLTIRPILALAYSSDYVYDGEPELSDGSVYLTTKYDNRTH